MVKTDVYIVKGDDNMALEDVLLYLALESMLADDDDEDEDDDDED